MPEADLIGLFAVPLGRTGLPGVPPARDDS